MAEPLKYPEWQTAYLAAMTELDDTKLPAKTRAAEEAISRRLRALPTSGHDDELMALEDAIRALRILVSERPKPLGPD